MPASALEPVKPRNRLQTLATVVSWVFWLAAAVTALQLILALSRSGALLTWNVDWGQWSVAWPLSWPVFWFGLGLVIFARVMRIGAGMRADLEVTV